MNARLLNLRDSSTGSSKRDVRDRFNLVSSELESRYRVVGVVAVGGFGVVYEGHDLRLGVPVAIKVLNAEGAPNETERRRVEDNFVCEARTVARLRHPHIVRVQDLGVSRMPSGVTAPWMALEWLGGRTLQAELRARGGRRMSPAEALAIVRPVMDAVAHAHGEGVVHRDLKPSNIMLSRVRRSVWPYVLDFGVAKALHPDEPLKCTGNTATRSPDPVGFTAAYAAREQVIRTRTGPWTDVHALGLILTELLVGRRAYDGEGYESFVNCALRDARPTPARFGVDAGALEPVIARALALSPDDRYSDAREMLAALDAAVAPTAEVGVTLATREPPAPEVEIVDESGERPCAAVSRATTPMTAPVTRVPTPIEPTPPNATVPPTAQGSPKGPTQLSRVGAGVGFLTVALACGLAGWSLRSMAAPRTPMHAPAPARAVAERPVAIDASPASREPVAAERVEATAALQAPLQKPTAPRRPAVARPRPLRVPRWVPAPEPTEQPPRDPMDLAEGH